MSNPLFDAQSVLGFVVSQTSIIEPGVYATRYPDIQYRTLIPVDTSGSEFASSVTYYSSNGYGKADWINGNSDDIPKAGTDRSKFETPVYTAGIGYGYGWEEIGKSQLLGINLPNEDAMAARRASEEMIDRVALLGDASKGFTGLFNAQGVTPAAAPNGDWGTVGTPGTADADEIVEDLNAGLLGVFNTTNTVEMADTQVMPWSKFQVLATRRMSTDSDESILSFYLRNNAFTAMSGRPLTLRGLRGLDTAGVSGVARLISYRNDPQVLKLHLPMPHRFLPVWQSGPLRWDVPGVMRLGGLDVRLPGAVSYLDGI